MRTDVDPELLAAARRSIRTPFVQAYLTNPLRPEPRFDLSPYIKSLQIQLPPTLKAGICRLTCTNPGKVISKSNFFRADYELNVFLGYKTPFGLRRTRVGRFWLDSPQYTLTTGGNGAGSAGTPNLLNEVAIQARDGYKLFAERHFQSGEVYDLGSLSMRQAFLKLASFVTIGGAPVTVKFDQDQATQQALDINLVQATAGPTDTAKTALSLLKDVIGNLGFLVFFDQNGELSVGLKNQVAPAVTTIGGIERLARPIYNRSILRSSLETGNEVFVQGNTDFADVRDEANIADTGRVKYIFIDDPTLVTPADCLLRARQALDLTLRFREQPDLVLPWQPDLERRDILAIDDAKLLGLDRGYYRLEDVRYTYEVGSGHGGTSAQAQPQAQMELGMGIIGADQLTSESGSSLPSQGA